MIRVLILTKTLSPFSRFWEGRGKVENLEIGKRGQVVVMRFLMTHPRDGAYQVMAALQEQQAALQHYQVTAKILGDVKHSYLNNMDSLASAIGHEVHPWGCIVDTILRSR